VVTEPVTPARPSSFPGLPAVRVSEVSGVLPPTAAPKRRGARIGDREGVTAINGRGEVYADAGQVASSVRVTALS